MILLNKTVFLNLTDSKNRTKKYNSTTDTWGDWKVWNIKPGKYNYSAIFPGDDEYNPSYPDMPSVEASSWKEFSFWDEYPSSHWKTSNKYNKKIR